jgi:hypothetical protein
MKLFISRKNVFKEAGVLFIVILIVFSSLLVMADTGDHKPIKLCECNDYETSRYCFIDEDFTTWIPAGWAQEESDEWSQSNSNRAGGAIPEAFLAFYKIKGNYSWLMTPSVDTTSAAILTLEFKSNIDDYCGGYTCKVFTRANPADSWTDRSPWSNPINGNVGPSIYCIDITDDVGVDTEVRFEFSGYYWNIDYWFIDDVKICDGPCSSPKVCCEGSLSWTNITPNSTVTGGPFSVQNCGTNGSILQWYVQSWPSWMGISNPCSPSSGTLVAPSSVLVTVNFIAPPNQNMIFTGSIVIGNLNNPSDNCSIPIYLETPRNQQKININIPQFLKLLYQFLF